MSWSAPMTAVANTAFAAVDFNSDVRDNLLETEPGRALSTYGQGSIPAKSATNEITFRTPAISEITTQQSTSNSSYTNLSSAGPSVTAATGANALVFWHASISVGGSSYGFMSLQVTNGGSVTHSANDNRSIRHSDQTGSNGEGMIGVEYLFTDLTPGTNVFQAKYRSTGSSASFRYRRIGVIPL